MKLIRKSGDAINTEARQRPKGETYVVRSCCAFSKPIRLKRCVMLENTRGTLMSNDKAETEIAQTQLNSKLV